MMSALASCLAISLWPLTLLHYRDATPGPKLNSLRPSLWELDLRPSPCTPCAWQRIAAASSAECNEWHRLPCAVACAMASVHLNDGTMFSCSARCLASVPLCSPPCTAAVGATSQCQCVWLPYTAAVGASNQCTRVRPLCSAAVGAYNHAPPPPVSGCRARRPSVHPINAPPCVRLPYTVAVGASNYVSGVFGCRARRPSVHPIDLAAAQGPQQNLADAKVCKAIN